MLDKNKFKAKARERRRARSRSKIFGTAERPRLSVFRSLGHIYAQLIDDTNNSTILSASDNKLTGSKKEKARQVGTLIAKQAKEKGLSFIIGTDSHNTKTFPYIKFGIATARRGWIEKKEVLNTLPLKDIKKKLGL